METWFKGGCEREMCSLLCIGGIVGLSNVPFKLKSFLKVTSHQIIEPECPPACTPP